VSLNLWLTQLGELCLRGEFYADERERARHMGMLTSKRRDDGGAAAVEFALVMPILLILVFGIVQYGFYFYAMQSGSAAIGDAARRVAVGNCQTTAQVQTLLKNKLGPATTAAASTDIATTITYTNPDGSAGTAPGQIGGSVLVTATFPTLDLHFPFLPVPGAGTVTRSTFARIEDIDATQGQCS
jgi:Flp pilus assembly protein TadG